MDLRIELLAYCNGNPIKSTFENRILSMLRETSGFHIYFTIVHNTIIGTSVLQHFLVNVCILFTFFFLLLFILFVFYLWLVFYMFFFLLLFLLSVCIHKKKFEQEKKTNMKYKCKLHNFSMHVWLIRKGREVKS